MLVICFQNVTSETVVSRELYCVMGCNEALNSYYQKLRGEEIFVNTLTMLFLYVVFASSLKVYLRHFSITFKEHSLGVLL